MLGTHDVTLEKLNPSLQAVLASIGSVNAAQLAAVIHAATAKTTPAANDEFSMLDSAAAYALKRIKWSEIAAAMALEASISSGGPTVYVALSDATDNEKAKALASGGYVCDGRDDDVELNAALATVTTDGTNTGRGLSVEVSRGTAYCGRPICAIDPAHAGYGRFGILFKGQGLNATCFRPQEDQGTCTTSTALTDVYCTAAAWVAADVGKSIVNTTNGKRTTVASRVSATHITVADSGFFAVGNGWSISLDDDIIKFLPAYGDVYSGYSIYKSFKIYGNRGDMFPDLQGTADSDHATILTNSTKAWPVDGLIGNRVVNSTDGSSGMITDNDATTLTTTLEKGSDNSWDAGDAYYIMRKPLYQGENDVEDLTGLVLTDNSQNWAVNELIGAFVHNYSDGAHGSKGIVASNTAHTVTLTGALKHGTDNDWNTGDLYNIDIKKGCGMSGQMRRVVAYDFLICECFGDGIFSCALGDSGGVKILNPIIHDNNGDGIWVGTPDTWVVNGTLNANFNNINVHRSGAQLLGNHLTAAVRAGLQIGERQDTLRMVLMGTYFDSNRMGIEMANFGLYDSIILGNMFWRSGYGLTADQFAQFEIYPVHDNFEYNLVAFNTLNGESISKYGISLPNGSHRHNYCRFAFNTFRGHVTKAVNEVDDGTDVQWRFNQGLVTEATGASSGTGAQQTIAHGLAFTPTAQQIALFAGSATANPFHSAAPDATNIYVTATSGQAWYWAKVG